jgi:hypothetical protein
MNAKQKEQQDAVRELREILKPGDTVFTKLISVSRSGMSRVIMPLVIRNNEPRYLDWKVAKATGYTLTPTGSGREGVKIGGCGMDMGFALVYRLSSVLFPDGHECIGQGCPSNDHSNGDRDYTPHHHSDGGYALKHRWF